MKYLALVKRISLYIMAIFYTVAGINHFVNPGVYMSIMPPWLPFHLPLVWLSGICETVFGVLLIPVRTRVAAAWLIVLLLIAIFPANIQMALDYGRRHHPSLLIAIIRLPVQFLLIAWAWSFTRPAKASTASQASSS